MKVINAVISVAVLVLVLCACTGEETPLIQTVTHFPTVTATFAATPTQAPTPTLTPSPAPMIIAAISASVFSADAVSRSSVQKEALKIGFIFGEVDTSGGEETLTGKLMEGSCNLILTLVGPDPSLTSTSLKITGCSDEEQSGWVFWFMMSLGLVPAGKSMDALSYAGSMDVYYVIEGEIETTGEKEISNVIFETKRSEDPEPTLLITARLKK